MTKLQGSRQFKVLDKFFYIRYTSAVMAGYKKRPPRKRRKARKRKAEGQGTDGGSEAEAKDFIEIDGVIEERLPAASFRVRLENGQTILCYLSGKMRMFRIRLLPGDEVKVEMTPYDLTKGRIVFRY